jgi:hypothetical protein
MVARPATRIATKPSANLSTTGFATMGHSMLWSVSMQSLGDVADPQRFGAQADSPNMLHSGGPDYKLMANGFDLPIFGSKAGPKSAKSSTKKQ